MPPAEKGAMATSPAIPSAIATQKRLRVHSLRLSALGERGSSVMGVSEYDEYAGNDPIMKAFGSSAHNTVRDVMMSGQLVVVPSEAFAETLVTRASSSQSDLVMIPWSETGVISESTSSLTGTSERDPLRNRDFAKLLGDIFDRAASVASVGVFVDRTLIRSPRSPSAGHSASDRIARVPTHTSQGEHLDHSVVTYTSSQQNGNHLEVLYAGTHDDLFAVKLALQMAQNEDGSFSITKLRRSSVVSGEAGDMDDTSYNDLEAQSSSVFGSCIRFTSLDIVNVDVDHFVEAVACDKKQSKTFIVGRTTAGFVADQASDIAVLGQTAASLVRQMRNHSTVASVFVVQAKSCDSDGAGRPALGRTNTRDSVA